jgi:hypothetical protein
MPKRFSIITMALIALPSLYGCSRPLVAPKPIAVQDKENTVRDWASVAQRIANALSDRGFLAPSLPASPPAVPPASDRRLFVHLLRPESTFLQDVRTHLESEILARGGIVSRIPANATVINLDIDVVRWSNQPQVPDGALTLTGLMTGAALLVAYNGPYMPAAGFGMAAGAGIAAEMVRSLSPDTNVEAVWGASILSGDDVVLALREPVYIRQGDIRLYEGTGSVRAAALGSFSPRPMSIPVRLRYVQ